VFVVCVCVCVLVGLSACTCVRDHPVSDHPVVLCAVCMV